MKLFGARRFASGDLRPNPVEKLRERAWQAFAEKNFDLAARTFEEWTTAEPNSASAWFGYAWSTFRVSSELGLPPEGLLSRFRHLAEKSLALHQTTGGLQPHQLAGTHVASV